METAKKAIITSIGDDIVGRLIGKNRSKIYLHNLKGIPISKGACVEIKDVFKPAGSSYHGNISGLLRQNFDETSFNNDDFLQRIIAYFKLFPSNINNSQDQIRRIKTSNSSNNELRSMWGLVNKMNNQDKMADFILSDKVNDDRINSCYGIVALIDKKLTLVLPGKNTYLLDTGKIKNFRNDKKIDAEVGDIFRVEIFNNDGRMIQPSGIRKIAKLSNFKELNRKEFVKDIQLELKINQYLEDRRERKVKSKQEIVESIISVNRNQDLHNTILSMVQKVSDLYFSKLPEEYKGLKGEIIEFVTDIVIEEFEDIAGFVEIMVKGGDGVEEILQTIIERYLNIVVNGAISHAVIKEGKGKQSNIDFTLENQFYISNLRKKCEVLGLTTEEYINQLIEKDLIQP